MSDDDPILPRLRGASWRAFFPLSAKARGGRADNPVYGIAAEIDGVAARAPSLSSSAAVAA